MPLSIVRKRLRNHVRGEYSLTFMELRIKQGIELDQAFTTAIHEMAHHALYIRNTDVDGFISDVRRQLREANYSRTQINDLFRRITDAL